MAPKRKFVAEADPDNTRERGFAERTIGRSVQDRDRGQEVEVQQQQEQQQETPLQWPANRSDHSPEAVPLSDIQNYPRKRIAIACNLCRFRKTKCDATRPTCGFCARLGVQCQYRESVHASSMANENNRGRHSATKSLLADDTAAASDTSQRTALGSNSHMSNLERRLSELETKWAELERRKLDVILASGATFSGPVPADDIVSQHLSCADLASPMPGGSDGSSTMALPALLGGPSPPSSTTDMGMGGTDAAAGAAQAKNTDTLSANVFGQPLVRQAPVVSSATASGPSGTCPVGQAVAVQLSSRLTTHGWYTARPSLLTFECAPYIPSESYDDTGAFYDSEMAAGDDFQHQMEHCLATFPDTSKRTLMLLMQKFVENFLGWIPLFEPAAVYTVVNAACASRFAPTDPNSCLAMLIMATGSLLQSHSNIRFNPLPGFDYFSHGSQLLGRFTFMYRSLTTLHCRILQSAYFKLALHPLLSRNVILQATHDCMNVLNTHWFKSLGQAAREPWHRAFWACSIMSDELEALLRIHTTGHRMYHEIVPLPRFENEDTGFYYFLAQITLRKLVCDTLDMVGYHDGQVVYMPVVTNELRSQAHEWHRHLPMAIRFPLDNTPLFDARKSFLRMQYFSLLTVLEWASVLKVMEAHGTEREHTDDIAVARIEAAECFRYCALYLDVAAEQLLGWQLGTNVSLWTTFAFLAMMIVSHKAAALAFISVTHEDAHMHSALELLRPWSHMPYVANGLTRMTGMMKRSGIRVAAYT